MRLVLAGLSRYGRICANWALETFAETGEHRNSLQRHGFVEIQVKDVSL